MKALLKNMSENAHVQLSALILMFLVLGIGIFTSNRPVKDIIHDVKLVRWSTFVEAAHLAIVPPTR